MLTGCGGPEKPTIQSEDYADSGSNRSRIKPILERRAKALLDKNEEAYLADLDPSNKELVEQEKLVFANLRQFEFAEFRYVLNNMTERTDDEGGIAVSPVIRIAKLSADAGPGDIAPGETFIYRFVKKGDKLLINYIWRLTSENQEELGVVGPYADAPWHTDELTVEKVGDRVWLVADKSVNDLGRFAAVTERELGVVEKMWGDREKFPGNVLFFTRDTENFRQWFGNAVFSPSGGKALGVQIPQYGVKKNGQFFTSQYVASRIVVNLAAIDASGGEPWSTVRHELTHAVTAKASLTGGNELLRAPTWAVEGFARYSESIDKPNQAARIRGYVASQARAGKFKGRTPKNDEFYGEDVSFNYDLGATVFLAAEKLKGRDAAVELYATIIQYTDSADHSFFELPVFESISQRVLGMSAGAFNSRWKSYVRNGG